MIIMTIEREDDSGRGKGAFLVAVEWTHGSSRVRLLSREVSAKNASQVGYEGLRGLEYQQKSSSKHFAQKILF